MVLDTTGISNENEFYTDHYLRAILEDDLKDVFSRWNDEAEKTGLKPPDQLLRALPQDYFKTKADLEKLRRLPEIFQGQQEFVHSLIDVLGYEVNPVLRVVESGACLPVLSEICKSNGSPELWIVEAVSSVQEPEDPLLLTILNEQYPETDDEKLLENSLSEIITREVFGLNDPPRWILVVNFNTILLIDRSKWNEKRLLRFDINEIFGRRESSTFRAMAALLHRDSICPDDGQPLLDTLDENSHKHAFQVSEDLKYSLREAIELIGNETIYYLHEVRHEGIYGKEYSDQLTLECLRYMYRMLFLLYLEARPELGYADMKSDVYRTGYSLESLRDLEIVPLTTEESRNGYYIHNSISMLFDLVYNGFEPHLQQELNFEGKPLHHTFTTIPLKSHLFDPERTPILNRVKFRNSILQRVIELMSLSRPKGGRRNRRGRISYAQLGINQLGAVYEGLLSYRGFFAETDLYEVKRADQERVNELEQAFFVKEEDLPKYKEEEKVFNTQEDQERNPAWKKGKLRKYPKGTFIYRLAGRDREKSASYYTPEVLTRCLVKYALKELLKDKTADDILKLKICEPAMGSAAFLNEAINQLADAYMQLKQKELDQVLAPDEYTRERQKVKMLIADENVFGVDLNPIAVELAEVSLWLNSIHPGGFVPWFGMQLVAGNSLIGARRQLFDAVLLGKRKTGEKSWLDEVPKRYWPNDAGANPPTSEINKRTGMVYHFLVPDPGMANYNDKVVKQLAGENIKKINDWRKEFIKPFNNTDIQILKNLSDTIDRLWNKHTEQLRKLRKETTDPLEVFGQINRNDNKKSTSTRDKDKKYAQELLSKNIRNSSLYRRLKLAMDYWCALWFWPIDKADLLPTRDEYLTDLQLILEGEMVAIIPQGSEQMLFFPSTAPKQEMLALKDEFGFVDIEKLSVEVERLGLVKELVERFRFLHWELEFADLFADNGGFDLILGNPPWIRVEWQEGGLMGDLEPLFVLRKLSASTLVKLRQEALDRYKAISDYLLEFEGQEGTQQYLNSIHNYPYLKGIQTNLYKCFLPQAWYVGSQNSTAGFLHPEGVYDDPNGQKLRQKVYSKLARHFQFDNELRLFADVHHSTKFSVNIYGNVISNYVKFDHISNLFAVSTIDMCYEHVGYGVVGGIKDNDGKWNVAGHRDRIILVDLDLLILFANLYDKPGTLALDARLPAIHSVQIIEVLLKFVQIPKHLGDFRNQYTATVIWDETNSQKDGTIRRKTIFPIDASELILSGPHFYVGNPLYKTPRQECKLNSHYDSIDLSIIPDDYLPRTNYVPDCSPNEYRKRTPSVLWDKKSKVTDYYKIIFRAMIGPSGERTLIPTVIPRCCAHIHSSISLTFQDVKLLLSFQSLLLSIPYDFFLKTTGRPHLYETILATFPLIESKESSLRGLLLTCITSEYENLWKICLNYISQNDDAWTKKDTRLSLGSFSRLTTSWNRDCTLRTDYERRQALIEIDVLVAMALGLTLDELCTIYRIQFPVLQQNENDTWYDRNGRIIFTCSKGLPGVGLTRNEWNEAMGMTSGTVEKTVTEDIMPDYRKAHAKIRLKDGTILNCPCPDYPEPIPGPVERLITYVPPFDKCDREEDYRIAWEEFKRRGL